MTDEAALLAAILADPADDTRRLAYADALEENSPLGPVCAACDGHGGFDGFSIHHGRDIKRPDCPRCLNVGYTQSSRQARAEFIRVQVELARTQCSPLCNLRAAGVRSNGCVCTRATLRRRERELWDRHGADWRGSPLNATEPMGHWLAGRNQVQPIQLADKEGHNAFRMNAEFTRGFVSEITCTAADWLAHSPSLVWRPGETMECPGCGGSGVRTVDTPYDSLAWDAGEATVEVPCKACGGTRGRDGTGRVPRPMPPTAQPIERVVLTSRPQVEYNFGRSSACLVGRSAALRLADYPEDSGPDGIERALLAAEWSGITFVLPGDEPTPDEQLGEILDSPSYD
jgi:hypothetical protein